MGITEKMNQMATSIQKGTKNATTSLFGTWVKILTSFIVSLTTTMILQELFNYGTLSFVFVMIVTAAALLKVLWTWTIGAVLIFDLICALVGLLLRMYILIAP